VTDLSKGKRKRKSTPQHSAAEGYSDQLAVAQGAGNTHRVTEECSSYHKSLGEPSDNPFGRADAFLAANKSASDMAASATNTGRPDVGSYNTQRVSPALSRGQGHQAVSSGDHGGSDGPRAPRRVAVDHPDLRQSNTSFSAVLANLRTVRGNVVDLGIPDSSAGGFSHAGEVALRSFDSANQAGNYRGLSQPVDHNPLRDDYHPAANSATSPNPCYPMGSAESNAVANKSRVDIMKACLFGHD
jgi:hypothetical protein